ncbi:lytic polysaccharide monooxygenase [Paenibacillus illinoisensis]|uniref:lytic polysaccharide monooxygenase n=1 Tax=Paenibacillus illinoisensis TaxID=59845 RepID=UPI001C8DADFA|nr:lytic polysaccharide monooxygenase [Paenibacillus illinoisensis]MBY0215411.1 lytic polysaccharide monooxygenase [Paenibacillus illinoisensis]
MSTYLSISGVRKISLIPKTILVFATGILFLLVYANVISAHGYLESPASRAYLCQQNLNSNCGQVQYEPQSVEAKGNFPVGGPSDGEITGGGIFPELYTQTAERWTKLDMQTGSQTFTWKLTAAHATKEWKYYITKKDWNPDAPIERKDLELFCSYSDGGKLPEKSVSHQCEIPADRTGYHVILGVWEIADTGNAFYQALDVNLTKSGSGNGSNTDETAPTAPTDLKASNITTKSLTLSWHPSTDNVSVMSYELYQNGHKIATIPGTSVSYDVSGLSQGTTYTYALKAIDAAGNESPLSAEITVQTTSATTPDTSAPTAPSHLHAHTVSATSVSLMWSSSTDNVAVNSYDIYQGSDRIATVNGNVTSYEVTGLKSSSTYTFSIKAKDSAGNVSEASNVITVTTLESSPPVVEPDVPKAWAENTSYRVGDRVLYKEVIYICRQAHTSIYTWTPSEVLALWLPE